MFHFHIVNFSSKTFFITTTYYSVQQNQMKPIQKSVESMTRYSPSVTFFFLILLHTCILLLFRPKGNLTFILRLRATRIVLFCAPLVFDWRFIEFCWQVISILTFYMTPLSNVVNTVSGSASMNPPLNSQITT